MKYQVLFLLIKKYVNYVLYLLIQNIEKRLKENEMNQLRWEEARSDLNTKNKIVKGN